MDDETLAQDPLLLSAFEILLQPVAARSPQVAAAGKERFLCEARSLVRQVYFAAQRARQRTQWVNFLSGALIGLMLLFAGACTGTAARYSLPGDRLYPLKEWGEQVHLLLAIFPEDDLSLMLHYTDRRLTELTELALGQRAVPENLFARTQAFLENTLQVSLALDDNHLVAALAQVEADAEQQLLLVYGLLAAQPYEPRLMGLCQRLQEQARLAELGQADPQAFRSAVRARQQGGGPDEAGGMLFSGNFFVGYARKNNPLQIRV